MASSYPKPLAIATWNVNSLRIRLPHLLAWLAEHQPHIVCLQETKMEDANFPAQALQEAGYFSVFAGQKSYNGVAILSREPCIDTAIGFTHSPYEALNQARLITTTTFGVRVMSVYVPNGASFTSDKFTFKQDFYQALAAEVQAEQAAHPNTVIAGDFNIAADERDVANPSRAAKEIGFSPTERAWLTEFLGKTGLTDTLRAYDATPHIFSWWDYRTYGRSQQSGMRIDYLFTSPALTPAIRQVAHHSSLRSQSQPSDHIPVMLTLA